MLCAQSLSSSARIGGEPEGAASLVAPDGFARQSRRRWPTEYLVEYGAKAVDQSVDGEVESLGVVCPRAAAGGLGE